MALESSDNGKSIGNNGSASIGMICCGCGSLLTSAAAVGKADEQIQTATVNS